MMIEQHMARDGEEHLVRANNQEWIVSWSPPTTAPPEKPHGAAGVCVTSTNHIVLISANGIDWDLPAGQKAMKAGSKRYGERCAKKPVQRLS